MYVQGWDLGGLLAAQRLGRGRQSQGIAERRMNGEEESDAMIVAMKPANKARRTARRSWWSEASHPRGNRTTQHTPDAEPDFVCHMGWFGYGYGLVSRPINVMRGGAT